MKSRRNINVFRTFYIPLHGQSRHAPGPLILLRPSLVRSNSVSDKKEDLYLKSLLVPKKKKKAVY